MTTNWKLGLSFSLVTVLMWGLLPLGLKGVLGSMDPVTVSWYRFSISTLIALVWYGRSSLPALRKMSRGPFSMVSALAILGLLGNYILYIFGLDFTNPGAAQILIQIAPLILLVASVVVFRESFHSLQWVGVATFSVGMLLFFHLRLSDRVSTQEHYVLGVMLLLAASVAWAIYGLAQKKLLSDFHARDILLVICLGGSIILLPFSEPSQIMALNSAELGLLLFSGVNTIVAYGAFGLALSYWEASRVSAVIPLAPLLTLLFTALLNALTDWNIAAEPLGWIGVIGALLVVTGSAMAALPRRN